MAGQVSENTLEGSEQRYPAEISTNEWTRKVYQMPPGKGKDKRPVFQKISPVAVLASASLGERQDLVPP